MLENFFLVAGIITLAWIALIGFYLVISGQQRRLEDDLESLQRKVEEKLAGRQDG